MLSGDGEAHPYQFPKATACLPLQVRNEFYKDTQGVILVYDVGQKESFDALDGWLAEMKQELGPHGNMDSVVFVVCANKVSARGLEPPGEQQGNRHKSKENPSLLSLGPTLSKHLSLRHKQNAAKPQTWYGGSVPGSFPVPCWEGAR